MLLSSWLKRISDRIRSRRYQPDRKPKKPDRFTQLGLTRLEDRVVLTASAALAADQLNVMLDSEDVSLSTDGTDITVTGSVTGALGTFATSSVNAIVVTDTDAGAGTEAVDFTTSNVADFDLEKGLLVTSDIESTTINTGIMGVSASAGGTPNAIDIDSGSLFLNGNLTTVGRDILLAGNTQAGDGLSLTLTTGAGAGTIQITGSLDGTAGATAESLTLTAGTGDVTLADVGTAASNGLELIEITSANAASISGTVDLDSTLTANAESVTIQGDVTTGGEIDITATNGSITIQSELDSSANSSDMTLKATGDVSLSGATAAAVTGGGTFTVEADSEADGSGTFVLDDAGGVVNTTGTPDGSVLVSAADVDLIGTINAGNGSVSFVSSQVSQAIALGAPVGGQFSLTDAEIDNVSAASLQVGEADDGNVTFTDAISPANAATLAIVTGGSVTETVSGTAFTGSTLTIEGKLAPGTSPGTFDVNGNFAFGTTAQFELEIDGVTPGTQHDQLIVAGNVDLNGAELELVFGTTLANGDEIILVSNDQSDVVTGQFVANFDIDNGTLGTPRTLAEGDIVLNNFGGSGSAGRITYSGGDGNDVAIVLTGAIITVNGIADANPDTLGFRFDGTDVDIVTGGTSNGITLNGGTVVATHATADIDTLRIVGVDGEDDIAVFDFSSGISTINVVYDGGNGGNDSLQVLRGTFDSITTTFNDADPSAGVIELDDGINAVSILDFTGLEPVLLNVGTANDIIFNLPDMDNSGANAVTISDGSLANDGHMLISGSNFEDTTFANPEDSLTINGGTMNDEILITSFDSLLNAGIGIAGGAGTDSIDIQQNFNARGDAGASFSAEQVDLASISAIGGSLTVTGVNIDLNGTNYAAVNVAGELNNVTVDGDLNLDNAGTITLTGGGAVGESVSVTGTINGAAGLVVTGGANGSASLGGQIGNSTRLTSLDLSGGAGISIDGADVRTTGNQNFLNDVVVSSDIMFDSDAGNITFNGELQGTVVGGVDDIVIDAGTGTLTITNEVGGDGNIGTLDVIAGTLTQNGVVTAQDSVTINASTLVSLNQDLTSGGVTTITVTGDNDGTIPFRLQSVATLASTSGMLTIQADDINVSGTINASGQTVLLRQNSDGQVIELGGVGGTNDELELSAVDLASITADLLRIGHSTAGNIEFTTGAVTPVNAPILSLITGGNITDNGAGSISATSLAIQATGTVTLDNVGNIDSLAASITGAGNSFTLANEDDGFTLGNGIDGLTGIATADNTSGNTGSITLLTTTGSIDVSQTLKTGDASGASSVTSGAISLTAGTGAVFGTQAPQTGSASSNNAGVGLATSGDIALTGGEISDDGAGAASGAFGVLIGNTSGGATNTGGSLFATATGSGDAGEIIISTDRDLKIASLDSTDADTTTIDITVTTAASTLTVTSAINLDQDDVTLTADDFTTTGAVSGTGVIVIQPLSTTRSIGIGGGVGDFNLDDADLGQLIDGFNSVTVGRTDGEHVISIDSATFNDPITIQAPNGAGTITVVDSGASTIGITGTGDALSFAQWVKRDNT